VLYQIYPRSFADADGDGVGDLPGIVDRLDHLAWLGVEGIWLSPVTVSPGADWGYDVADFCAIDPVFGTLDDFERLVAEAGVRGIRVLVDLVPNHTSVAHPWFVDARSSRTARHRDWYVWADGRPEGGPPNNWVSSFGGPAWTWDPTTSQYYLHNHLRAQPDLNWWNEDVRRAFDDILTTWLDRGVAGFRIDVCNMIVKDAELRDNPPATAESPMSEQLLGQRSVYNSDRPEVHEVLRRWRAVVDGHPGGGVLVGETPVETVGSLATYYGTGRDELDLAFNFPFISAPLEAEALRSLVEQVEAALPEEAWPAWTGSNHDMSRLATRWAGGHRPRTEAALVMLLGLRGTPVLYQGDEIGLEDVDVPRERLRDPLGVAYWPAYVGRDGMRTPMPWSAGPGGGFTRPGVEPWLPFGDLAACNVEDQRADEGSTLHLVRRLVALRRERTDLAGGSYGTLPADPGVWAWHRGTGTVVAVNLSDGSGSVPGVAGTVLVGTDRSRVGATVSGALDLGAWEAVVLASEGDGDGDGGPVAQSGSVNQATAPERWAR
jgi:alpha-glucosidase